MTGGKGTEGIGGNPTEREAEVAAQSKGDARIENSDLTAIEIGKEGKWNIESSFQKVFLIFSLQLKVMIIMANHGSASELNKLTTCKIN